MAFERKGGLVQWVEGDAETGLKMQVKSAVRLTSDPRAYFLGEIFWMACSTPGRRRILVSPPALA